MFVFGGRGCHRFQEPPKRRRSVVNQGAERQILRRRGRQNPLVRTECIAHFHRCAESYSSRWRIQSRNAPLNWFSDSSLEKVLDPVRLESNLRAVKFARTSSTVAEIEFVHSAGETPVAVCISSLSIPARAKDFDIEIDVKSVDDSKITVTVKPADHGIGVGVTAFFQTAGLSGEA